jgi:hypothetical protein
VPRSISFFSPLIGELRHGRRCIAFDLPLEVVGRDVRHAHGGLIRSFDNPASVPSPPARRRRPHLARGQTVRLQVTGDGIVKRDRKLFEKQPVVLACRAFTLSAVLSVLRLKLGIDPRSAGVCCPAE